LRRKKCPLHNYCTCSAHRVSGACPLRTMRSSPVRQTQSARPVRSGSISRMGTECRVRRRQERWCKTRRRNLRMRGSRWWQRRTPSRSLGTPPMRAPRQCHWPCRARNPYNSPP
jgi:hypothetical protein